MICRKNDLVGEKGTKVVVIFLLTYLQGIYSLRGKCQNDTHIVLGKIIFLGH